MPSVRRSEAPSVTATIRATLLSSAIIPVAAGVATLLLLGLFAAVDPPTGVTASNSPFTDEAWNVVNARNLIVLGTWATDDWKRQLVSVPFSIAHAFVFWVAGVGIIQGRFVEILATAATCTGLVAGLRRPLGIFPALIAGLSFSSCALVLYYGRLIYLEPLTSLGLAIAGVLVVGTTGARAILSGAAAGLAIACAVGTKLVAVPDASGLLIGVALAGFGIPGARRWLVAAVGGVAVAFIVWGVLVWLPNRSEVAAVLRTYPGESLPGTLQELLSRVHGYLLHNDNVGGLAGPLLLGAALGSVAAIVRWRHLTPAARLLVAGALGWAIAGFGTLAIVPYSPNRYVVPTLPALAILVGVGAHALAGVLSMRSGPPLRLARVAIGLVLGAGLSAPGLIQYARWMSATPSTLPAVQERVPGIIPTSATVEGFYAPLFAMRAKATTIFTAFHTNPGDLYATRHVRWFIGRPDEVPSWTREHAAAWAGRQEVMCAPWGGGPVCVYAIP
jgi:hypothetical protein